MSSDGHVLGVGVCRDVDAEAVLATVRRVLAVAGVPAIDVLRIATIEIRAAEPGLVAAAVALGVPLVGHPASVLAQVPVAHPSTATLARVGTPSVAEAAARYAGPDMPLGVLVAPKSRDTGVPARATVALARHERVGRGGG